jgi:hypothetical protein
LSILVEWAVQGAHPSSSDSDELLHDVRRVATEPHGTAHERLTLLNALLVRASWLPTAAARRLTFAEALLAKAAVLNDHAREFVGSLEASRTARRWRYARVLRLGSHAAVFARRIRSYPTLVRALHYRAVANTMRGRLDLTMSALRVAEAATSEAVRAGVSEFHPLSTPGRLVQELAVTRARLGGDSTRVFRDFERGAALVDMIPAGEEEAQAPTFRRLKVALALRDWTVAENLLSHLWSSRLSSQNSQRQLLRLEAELRFRSGDREIAQELIDQGLSAARSASDYREEFQLSSLREECRLTG